MFQKQRVSAHIGGQHKDPMWLTEYPKMPSSAPPPNSCIQVSIWLDPHGICLPLRMNTALLFLSRRNSSKFFCTDIKQTMTFFALHYRSCGFSKIFDSSYKLSLLHNNIWPALCSLTAHHSKLGLKHLNVAGKQLFPFIPLRVPVWLSPITWLFMSAVSLVYEIFGRLCLLHILRVHSHIFYC